MLLFLTLDIETNVIRPKCFLKQISNERKNVTETIDIDSKLTRFLNTKFTLVINCSNVPLDKELVFSYDLFNSNLLITNLKKEIFISILFISLTLLTILFLLLFLLYKSGHLKCFKMKKTTLEISSPETECFDVAN